MQMTAKRNAPSEPVYDEPIDYGALQQRLLSRDDIDYTQGFGRDLVHITSMMSAMRTWITADESIADALAAADRANEKSRDDAHRKLGALIHAAYATRANKHRNVLDWCKSAWDERRVIALPWHATERLMEAVRAQEDAREQLEDTKGERSAWTDPETGDRVISLAIPIALQACQKADQEHAEACRTLGWHVARFLRGQE